ncbi:MAG: ROK family protein [Verrucomicrobiota bacterium]
MELDAWQIQSAVYDANLGQRATVRLSTKADRGVDAVLGRIERSVREAVDEADLRLESIAGVTVGVPGVVTTTAGPVTQWRLFGWPTLELVQALSLRLGLPVRMENTGNLAALGASVADVKPSSGRLLAIFIGHGVHGGIIEAGRIAYDSAVTFPLISHGVVSAQGPGCPCGQSGCVDSLASGRAILQQVKAGLKNGADSMLAGQETVGLDDWRKAIKQDDPLAVLAAREAARHLGTLLVLLIQRWQPQQVVLGGPVVDAAEKLIQAEIQDILAKHLNSLDQGVPPLVYSQLGKAACTFGAAVIMRQELQADVER